MAVAGVVTRWVRDGDYKAVNYERVSQLIRKAAGQGAQFLALSSATARAGCVGSENRVVL